MIDIIGVVAILIMIDIALIIHIILTTLIK
jgi:hypothetical protein